MTPNSLCRGGVFRLIFRPVVDSAEITLVSNETERDEPVELHFPNGFRPTRSREHRVADLLSCEDAAISLPRAVGPKGDESSVFGVCEITDLPVEGHRVIYSEPRHQRVSR